MKIRLAVLFLLVAAVGCRNNLPCAPQLMHPGPGVGGPGPGVMTLGPMGPGAGGMCGPGPVAQVSFVSPEGMMITWQQFNPGMFDSEVLIAPARSNFPQGAIYRLRISNLPGRPGVELYPTVEIAPPLPRTAAYLAHNTIPVQFTEEDLDQVLTGNFVTKVIYLPDPEFQELAVAGVETLVSTRLDPGLDPIVEADRRGSILAIIRIGNKDLEVPGNEMTGQAGAGVVQASFNAPCDNCGPGGPVGGGGYDGAMLAGGDLGMMPGGGFSPAGYISGVTGPEYGMTHVGTPIGLPGPPHIPLGGPAGLKSHKMYNHTLTRIPNPVNHQNIHVRQSPGISYPRPARNAYIRERAWAPFYWLRQPFWDKRQRIADAPAACVTDCP